MYAGQKKCRQTKNKKKLLNLKKIGNSKSIIKKTKFSNIKYLNNNFRTLPTRTCGGLVTFFVRAHVAGFLDGSQHGHSETTQRRSDDGE